MTHRIYDKTDKGREEIATRKHRLPSRLRTLLVMIDGKQRGDDLLAKVAGIGLTTDSIGELLNNGFIQAIAQLEPLAPKTVQTSAPTASEMPLAGSHQFQAIYAFFNETIKSTLGLRGYALQLKVEKASSVDDFRALRDPYLEAVLKSKGKETAHGLQLRLDQLLYPEEARPDTAIDQ